MGYLKGAGPGTDVQPISVLRERFGFVPAIFREQSLRPEVIGAEADLVGSVISRDGALSRLQKESIVFVVAAALRNAYWISAQYQSLRLIGLPERQIDNIGVDHAHAGLSPATAMLLTFAQKICLSGSSVRLQDIVQLVNGGIREEAVLEAIVTTALAIFLCTLATGLGTAPDFGMRNLSESDPADLPDAQSSLPEESGPYLAIPGGAEDCAGVVLFRDAFGFAPNILKVQLSRPEIVDAEWNLMRAILLSEGGLEVRKRRLISMAVSAANLNSCGVALHSAIGAAAGISVGDAADPADIALLDWAVKLAREPRAFGETDVESLRSHGFDDAQMLDAALTTALTGFLDALQFGLGTSSDFELQPTFQIRPAKIVNPDPSDLRPIAEPVQIDPDGEPVERVQAGDLHAFEALIERHSRRVYRTLIGILGNPDEARDAMQDTFLKAFQHIGSFQQRARFSTWLVSIASNTAIQRIRDRKGTESLDDTGFDHDDGFRPRQVQSWTDDPEKMYSQMEVRSLVEKGVMSLPAKYRVVVMLRDIEQIPIEETARALGLGIPAVKSRLLRGRLMLRETLSPHFVSAQGPDQSAASMKGVAS